jgi:TolB-like protein
LSNPASDIHTPDSVLVASADSDMTGFFVTANFFGPRDTLPPDIRLKGWTRTQTVYLEKVYIEGRITDDTGIESVTINHHPILRRNGKNIFFGHMAELQKGENKIVIEATDDAGNVATREMSIIRQIPKALQLEERLSMTVLPFEQKALISGVGLSFQDSLIHSLVNQNRFRVVEREKLDSILQEQKLARTQLIDNRTALELGRLIASQSIITGSIVETNAGIEIIARMMDTETSEILAVKDVYDEVKDMQALRGLAEGMAIKFHREFPLLEGMIVQVKGKQIFTDLGQDKVKIPRKMIVYREDPVVHPVTGKIFGSDNIVMGRARVTQVMPNMSRAQMLTGDIGAIKPLDRVITE